MLSSTGLVLPHLLKAYISFWDEIDSLRDSIDLESLSVFGNNGGLALVSSLYFWNSFKWLLLIEVCWKVDTSIHEIFAGSVVGVSSFFRAGFVEYVLFPLIGLIFFHTSAAAVDELRNETYLNHDSFLLSLMIFRENALYFW